MATNRYFNLYNYGREQSLFEDLTIESIKQYGHTMKYLPKEFVAKDQLYGEDPLMRFDNVIELEMYLKDVQGFGGEGDFLTKFNLEIRDEVTFTVARKRYEQARSEKISTEVGWNWMLEDAPRGVASNNRAEVDTSFNIVQETSAYDYSNRPRPQEGDLIWFDISGDLFEIKFVEHEEIFYQGGILYTYDLKCDKYEYSGENLPPEFADVMARIDSDQLYYEFTLEDATGIIQVEDADETDTIGSIIQEEINIDIVDPTSDNTYYQEKVAMDDIIDFSESTPWSERY